MSVIVLDISMFPSITHEFEPSRSKCRIRMSILGYIPDRLKGIVEHEHGKVVSESVSSISSSHPPRV